MTVSFPSKDSFVCTVTVTDDETVCIYASVWKIRIMNGSDLSLQNAEVKIEPHCITPAGLKSRTNLQMIVLVVQL